MDKTADRHRGCAEQGRQHAHAVFTGVGGKRHREQLREGGEEVDLPDELVAHAARLDPRRPADEKRHPVTACVKIGLVAPVDEAWMVAHGDELRNVGGRGAAVVADEFPDTGGWPHQLAIREGKLGEGRGGAGPYGIGYRAILPKQAECDNLPVTFALSATHVAFASIRMEPVFMVTSQSAATAAGLAIDAAASLVPSEVCAMQGRIVVFSRP